MTIKEQIQFHPNEETAALAREFKKVLYQDFSDKGDRNLFPLEVKSRPVDLPPAAFKLFIRTLEALATGHGVTVIADDAEISTTEAAEILNVSRPYVIKLLDEEKIPYRMVGSHRRIRHDDLMAFKEIDKLKRRKILGQLVKEAQALGMGYDK